jgi:peptidoglycan hydrolase-like protein with peptidoglycan-binding domain
MVAMLAATGLSLAILYNALLGQSAGQGFTSKLAGGESGTTRLDVSAKGAGNTIQLKYDPVAENVQRELQAVGFYKGDIDGVVGRRTRDAILAYQKANGLEVTGQPSPDLVEHIRYTRQIAEASLFTGSVEPAPDAEQRARVRRVQTALAELAYYQGEISGELERPTVIAIRQFEREHGLPETGTISGDLMDELAKVSGQPQPQ